MAAMEPTVTVTIKKVVEPAPKRKPLFLREQTWAVLLAMAVPILNRKLGLELTPVDVAMVLSPLLALLGVDGVVAAIKVHHEKAAERVGAEVAAELAATPGEKADDKPAEGPGADA